MTALEIIALIVGWAFAFDYLTVRWQYRADRRERRQRTDELVRTLRDENAGLEREVARAFRFGWNSARLAQSARFDRDTVEFEPIRPRGVQPYLRAVDEPTAEILHLPKPDHDDAA